MSGFNATPAHPEWGPSEVEGLGLQQERIPNPENGYPMRRAAESVRFGKGEIFWLDRQDIFQRPHWALKMLKILPN
jgi:hypothetical protein